MEEKKYHGFGKKKNKAKDTQQHRNDEKKKQVTMQVSCSWHVWIKIFPIL